MSPDAVVCPYCGAPIRHLRNGACPFCEVALPGVTAPEAVSAVFDVVLHDCGRRKINVIKTIRGATGSGLAEAKDVADAAGRAGQAVALGLATDRATAERIAADLAGDGATASVAPRPG